MTAPEITVCVPVYNSAALVSEALESIARQTHQSFRVLVSVDPSPDASLAACRRWESDPRFRVIAQPARLGWPGNVNWLLERVATPRLCITPHDDWIAPDYLSLLSAALDAAPDAAIAFGDLDITGTHTFLLANDSLTGSPLDRVLGYLLTRFNGVEMRGLIRTEAVLAASLMSSRHEGFAADTGWLLELAAEGDFLRVPQAIYHKLLHENSVTAGWQRWPAEKLNAMWMAHAADCFAAALDARDWTPREREAVAAAAVARALMVPIATPAHIGPPPTMAAMLERIGQFARQISGRLPDLAAPPDPLAPEPGLAAWADETLGRVRRD